MIEFVDSHAHLADPAFDSDREQVILRARAAGATAVVCIGESLAAAARARAISGEHSGYVFFTAGVHPHDAEQFDAEHDIAGIETELQTGACAVGECGLDYHYENSPRASQQSAFAAQIEIARRWQRPLVVHTRDAENDTRSFLQSAARQNVLGVLHCFTGTLDLARAALNAGWYISFSGIITFKKWTDDALLRLVPDDRLLVESDAPYLAPVPNRGKRNEPAWVAFTTARLAIARQIPIHVLGPIIASNARRLFALPASNRGDVH
ncbi:MAG: TatD family hydrolase [Gemmatimonadaceae bacterium]